MCKKSYWIWYIINLLFLIISKINSICLKNITEYPLHNHTRKAFCLQGNIIIYLFIFFIIVINKKMLNVHQQLNVKLYLN